MLLWDVYLCGVHGEEWLHTVVVKGVTLLLAVLQREVLLLDCAYGYVNGTSPLW